MTTTRRLARRLALLAVGAKGLTLREKSHASIINFSILPALIPMPHAAEQGAPRKKNTIFVPNIPTMFRISTRLHAPSFPHPYFLKMPHANPPLGPLPHRQREDEPPNTASLPHPSPPTPSPEPTARQKASLGPPPGLASLSLARSPPSSCHHRTALAWFP